MNNEIPIVKPASELSNADLVQNLIELYARSGMYPDSKVLHDRWVQLKTETDRRFESLTKQRDDLWNQLQLEFKGVTLIRCLEHRHIPAYNHTEASGGECAACQVEKMRVSFASEIQAALMSGN